jgi:hypothetical protein
MQVGGSEIFVTDCMSQATESGSEFLLQPVEAKNLGFVALYYFKAVEMNFA